MKNEIRNVLSGKSEVRFGKVIQAISSYLGKSKSTGEAIKGSKSFRQQETENLVSYIDKNRLWLVDIDFSQYVSEGAEQKVYLKDSQHVIKLNDAIYYTSWVDYFHNLLLHNYFFPDTAYVY
ncbi:putative polyvalent protein kinase domain-containing protein [Pedobacter sp.]